MIPPAGYNKANPDQVCKLKKSIYGLRQASRCWNQELSKFLIRWGFVQSKQDYSMFIFKKTMFLLWFWLMLMIYS